MTTPFPPSAYLHGPPLSPSQLSEHLTQLAMWADDGVTIEDALARLQQSGLSLVQAGLVIKTYMSLPDSEVPPV